MRKNSLISIFLLSVTAVACDKSEFAAADSATQAYSVSVRVPTEDSTAETEVETSTENASTGSSDSKEPGKEPGKEGDTQGDCAMLAGVKTERVKVSGSKHRCL